MSLHVPDRRRGNLFFIGAHVSAIFMRVQRVPAEGETVLGTDLTQPVDGGKSTNQAVAAARMGAPVSFMSVLGSDERGDWWRDYLHEEKIGLEWMIRADGPTDMGVVLLPDSHIPAIISVSSLSQCLDASAVRAAERAISSASVVVCALEAPLPAVKAAFEIARGAGVTTLLNPAPVEQADKIVLGLADVIVPNEHEARALIGAAAPQGAAATAALLGQRHANADIVVTAGGDGAYIARGGQPVQHLAAPKVKAVDTTGAGDAFIGATCAMLHRGADLIEAVRFGVSAASRSVTLPGSIESYPSWEQMRQLVSSAGFVDGETR